MPPPRMSDVLPSSDAASAPTAVQDHTVDDSTAKASSALWLSEGPTLSGVDGAAAVGIGIDTSASAAHAGRKRKRGAPSTTNTPADKGQGEGSLKARGQLGEEAKNDETNNEAKKKNGNENGNGAAKRHTKQKRGKHSNNNDDDDDDNNDNNDRGNESTRRMQMPHSKHANKTNHPSLYTPWVLLPPREQKALAALGVGVNDTTNSKETVTTHVLVWNRNQNICAAVRRLQALLCCGSAAGAVTASTLDVDGDGSSGNGGSAATTAASATTTPPDTQNHRIIAVSAQGEGTVKLVGIVDMVRRIVGGASVSTSTSTSSASVLKPTPHAHIEAERGDTDGEGDGQKEGQKQGQKQPKNQENAKSKQSQTWFLYTVLGSVAVLSRRRGKGRGGVVRADADGHADGSTDGTADADAADADAMDVDIDISTTTTQPRNAKAKHHPDRRDRNRQDHEDAQQTSLSPVLTVYFSTRRLSGWSHGVEMEV